jgi:hypothetical protein
MVMDESTTLSDYGIGMLLLALVVGIVYSRKNDMNEAK